MSESSPEPADIDAVRDAAVDRWSAEAEGQAIDRTPGK